MSNFKPKHTFRKYQWPSDAVTKRQLDKKTDRLQLSIDRLNDRSRDLEAEITSTRDTVAKILGYMHGQVKK